MQSWHRLLLTALLLGGPATAHATEAPVVPRQRVVWSNLTALRLNPLGLQDLLKIGWQQRLFASEALLLRESFAGVSLQPTVTPALVRLGLGAEVQPVALLHLEAKWEWLQYFGVLDHLQSYPGAAADFSDSAVERQGDSAYAAGGWQATLAAELRLKAGPIVVRNKIQPMYVDMDLQGGDRFWYDPFFDVLAPRRGWLLSNDADLLWLVDPLLVVGVRHTLAHVAATPDTGPGRANTPVQRVGPLVAWSLFDRPGRFVDKPTVVLLVQWYLQHRWRTGADVDQAMPYVVLGLSLKGQAWAAAAR